MSSPNSPRWAVPLFTHPGESQPTPALSRLGMAHLSPLCRKAPASKGVSGAQSRAKLQEGAVGNAGSESLTLVPGFKRLRAACVQAEVNGDSNCHLALTIRNKNKICKGIDDRKEQMVRVCTHELQFLPIQVPSGPRAAAALHGLGGQRPRSLPTWAPVGRSGGGGPRRAGESPGPRICQSQGARRRVRRAPAVGGLQGESAFLGLERKACAPAWTRLGYGCRKTGLCSVRQTHRQLRSRRRGEVGCNLAGGGLFPGLRPRAAADPGARAAASLPSEGSLGRALRPGTFLPKSLTRVGA
nr:uncharacterized protein LOC123572749 [Macaca fascicularis]